MFLLIQNKSIILYILNQQKHLAYESRKLDIKNEAYQ